MATTRKANGRHPPLHDAAHYDATMQSAPPPAPVYAAPAPIVLDQRASFVAPVTYFGAMAAVVFVLGFQANGYMSRIDDAFKTAGQRIEKVETAVASIDSTVTKKLDDIKDSVVNAFSANNASTDSIRELRANQLTIAQWSAWCREFERMNVKAAIKCPALPVVTR